MKLKILVEFCDKYSGTLYRAGDIKDFEQERAKELLDDDRNLVEKVKVKKVVVE